MKRLISSIACCVWAAWAVPACAEPDPWLPLPEQVIQALSSSTHWQALQAQAQAEETRATQIQSIDNEWTAQTRYGSRRNRAADALPTDARTREWALGLDKQTRWPGQAQAAKASADAAQALARQRLAQAWLTQLHEALALHQAWLTASLTEQCWAHQLSLVQQQRDTVAQRQQLGDASRVDLLQMDAALAQTRARALQAQAQVRQTTSNMQARFPTWPLTGPRDATEPSKWIALTPPSTDDRLPQTAQAHPDTQLADHQWRWAQALHQQARQDATPAPTVGVQWASDRNGQEKTWTLSLSVPLGGSYRQQQQQALAYDEQAWAQQAQLTRERTELSLRDTLAAWHGTYQQWQQENAAHAHLQTVVAALKQGMTLGETALADLLTAQRMAAQQEVDLIERYVQLKALQWRWQADTQQAWTLTQSF